MHFCKLDNVCFHYLVGGGSRWTTRFIRTVWVRIVVSRIASFSNMVGPYYFKGLVPLLKDPISYLSNQYACSDAVRMRTKMLLGEVLHTPLLLLLVILNIYTQIESQ